MCSLEGDERYFKAVRVCDEVLSFLASYDRRDDAIERLELAIMDERLEALLGARESAETLVVEGM